MLKTIVFPSVLLFCGFAASLLVAQQTAQQKQNETLQPSDVEPKVSLLSTESTGQSPSLSDQSRYESDRNRYEKRPKPFTTSPSVQFSTTQPFRVHSQFILRDQKTKKLVAISSQDATEAEKEDGRVHLKEIGKAMDTIKSPESSDADKELARQIIAEELDLKFEMDLSDRQQQLKVIEKQLEDLRTQLTARQESKSKLIELRLQLIENEAKGLGFPSTWNNQSSMEWRQERTINGWPVPATIEKSRLPK